MLVNLNNLVYVFIPLLSASLHLLQLILIYLYLCDFGILSERPHIALTLIYAFGFAVALALPTDLSHVISL